MLLKKFSKLRINKRVQKLSTLHVVILLSILGIVAYANAIFHPFVHDDVLFIERNLSIASWSKADLMSIFTHRLRMSDVTPLANDYYRPLITLTHKIQYLFFGLNPYGYHFANIVFHIINSILLFTILILLKQSKTLSLSAAIIFLIHPVQTEAVACISGISNLLFSLFCFASFIFYIISERKSQRQKEITFYGISLACFLLALLTKEQAVILPLLIILYELCFLRLYKKPISDRIVRSLGFFFIAFCYFMLRRTILQQALPVLSFNTYEFYLRISSIPRALLTYFKILIFPTDLHYYRCADILKPFILPMVFFIFLVSGMVMIMRPVQKTKANILFFAVGWFVISLLPVLNIIPMVEEYSFVLTAEHFMYLPIIGFIVFTLLIGRYYFRRIFKERSSEIAWRFFLIVVVIFVLTTIKLNNFWSGEIPLFERTLLFEENLGRVRILLARAYYENGDIDKALKEYQTALEIMNNYARKVEGQHIKDFYLFFIKEIHFDVAHCYEQKKDYKRAIREYEKALAVDPTDSVIYNNLGTDYLYINDVNMAANYFRKALSLDPNNIHAMNNLAVIYIQKGQVKEAEQLLRKVLTIDKNSKAAQENLKRLLNAQPYTLHLPSKK